MRLTLRVVSQQSGRLATTAAHTFGPEGGTIGRGKNCTWVIADPDRFLSSAHARIEFRNNVFYLIDVSTNGCFVNGALTPLGRDNEHPLRTGDQIMMGDFQLGASIDSGPVQMTQAVSLRPVGESALGSGAMSSDPLAALDASTPPPPPPSTQIIPDDWDPKTAVPYRGGGTGGGAGSTAASGSTSASASGAAGSGAGGAGSGAIGGSGPGIGFAGSAGSGGANGGPSSAGSNNTGGFGFASRGGQGAAAPPPAVAPGAVPPPASQGPYILGNAVPPGRQGGSGQGGAGQSGGQDRPSMRPQRWNAGESQNATATDKSGISVAPSPFAASPVFNRATPAPPPPAAAPTPAAPTPMSPPPPYIPEAISPPPPATMAPADTPAAHSDGAVPRWPVPAPRQNTQAGARGSAGSGMDPAIAVFWQATGLDASELNATDMIERLSEAGAALREMASSIVQVLNARRMVKDEFRIHQTQLQPTQNNALKFLADGDMALHKMLVEQDQAFMALSDSVREAFDDIKAHEMATMAGMREAIGALLDQFSPETLEQKFGASSFGRGSKSKYWDAFTELYNDVADTAEDRFKRIFGEAFSRAYAEQLVLVRQRRRGT